MSTGHQPRRFVRTGLKVFEFLHIALALFGLWLVVPHLLTRRPLDQPLGPGMPYIEQAFLVMTGINLLLLLVEALAGILLLRLRPTGIHISNVLFTLMILSFLAHPVLFVSGRGPVRDSIAAAAGAGNIGIVFQLLIGYPVIALVVLNLLRRKLRPKPEGAPA